MGNLTMNRRNFLRKCSLFLFVILNNDYTWKFYINGMEIDYNRAVNRRGNISWPFRGSRRGDLCTATCHGIVFGDI